MKLVLRFVALATIAGAVPAEAQLPPGSYQRQCRDISLQGQFLSARCPSSRGAWAVSSINVASCSTGIGVDHEGGLICGGPGVDPNRPPPPGDYRPPGGRPPPPGYDRFSITIYDRFGYRGRSMRLDGDVANLDGTGFNDRVASIRLRKRSGPWLACENANFRGRCVTIDGDARDLSQFGMLNSVSSLRPFR